jgi:hypothetical protein
LQVQWAIPCRYVELAQGGATIVGAGADIAVLPQLPVPAQLIFAVRYVGSPEEFDGSAHPMGCRIFDPHGNALGEQSTVLTAEAAQLVPGYVFEMIVPTAVVLEVKEYGTHRFQFFIDDDTLNVPMHCVSEIPPPS